MSTRTIALTDYTTFDGHLPQPPFGATFEVAPTVLLELERTPTEFVIHNGIAYVFGKRAPLFEYEYGGYNKGDAPTSMMIDMSKFRADAKRRGTSVEALAALLKETMANEGGDEFTWGLRKQFPWLIFVGPVTDEGIDLWLHRNRGGNVDGVILDAGIFFDTDNQPIDQLGKTLPRLRELWQSSNKSAHYYLTKSTNVRLLLEELGRLAKQTAEEMRAIDRAHEDALTIDRVRSNKSGGKTGGAGKTVGRERINTSTERESVSTASRNAARSSTKTKLPRNEACNGTVVQLKEYAKKNNVPVRRGGRALRKGELLELLMEEGYC